MPIKKLFASVETNAEKYLDFLKNICSYEARAYDKETIDRMMDYITAFARAEGFEVTRKPMENCGDFLTVEINPGGKKGCLFHAHTDTVHEKGTFGQPPVRTDETRMYGPGVIDCKGGIAIALLTMQALLQNGYDQHVRLILTSDEEISNTLGGPEEIRFIQDSAAGFPYAINCETAEGDQVVIARKGILKYRLDIQGVSGHAGKHVFVAKNAVVEAAHKIIALSEKSTPDGTTYSCNIVHGGTVLNVIPDSCSVSVDVRARTLRDMEQAKAEMAAIAERAFIPGTSCQLTLLSALSCFFLTSGFTFWVLMQLAVYNKLTINLNTKVTGKNSGGTFFQSMIIMAGFFGPVIVIRPLIALFNETTAMLTILVIGLAFTLTHPLWLRNIYKRFMQRRYENMEGFRASITNN